MAINDEKKVQNKANVTLGVACPSIKEESLDVWGYLDGTFGSQRLSHALLCDRQPENLFNIYHNQNRSNLFFPMLDDCLFSKTRREGVVWALEPKQIDPRQFGEIVGAFANYSRQLVVNSSLSGPEYLLFLVYRHKEIIFIASYEVLGPDFVQKNYKVSRADQTSHSTDHCTDRHNRIRKDVLCSTSSRTGR